MTSGLHTHPNSDSDLSHSLKDYSQLEKFLFPHRKQQAKLGSHRDPTHQQRISLDGT